MYNALRSLLSLLIVGFVLVPAAHAQNDITITLDEAIQIALVENFILKSRHLNEMPLKHREDSNFLINKFRPNQSMRMHEQEEEKQ